MEPRIIKQVFTRRNIVNDQIIEQAFQTLFPKKTWNYEAGVTYSNKFRPYNAYVRMRGPQVTFALSKSWKEVTPDIQIGLLQTLMAKLWKKEIQSRTINMDMYESFMRKVGEFTPKENVDPLLKESFDRVNASLLQSDLPLANLVWGEFATTKLGHYEYATDTITISGVFRNAPTVYLDAVMHHEMLHKKHKFKSSKSRTRHHSSAFRVDEQKFPNFVQVEKELNKYVSYRKRTKLI